MIVATSYVEFIQYGFWTHDSYLEVLSYLLAREFNRLDKKDDWQLNLISKWRMAASAGFIGCVPSYLKDFDTHEKVQLLREILVMIRSRLEDTPTFLTAFELNQHTSREDWEDHHLPIFNQIVELTLRLIDGEMKTTAASPIDYWNFE